MKYEHIIRGTFISRPNRFIAYAAVRQVPAGPEATVVCHVRNTGRCRELLLPGAAVIIQFHPQAACLGRKTEYTLIGVYKSRGGECLLINLDSQAPNQAAEKWLRSMESRPFLPVCSCRRPPGGFSLAGIHREAVYGRSRFDLAFELVMGGRTKAAYMEVKGVTLEADGTAMFPDAPTIRGLKHVLELSEAVKAGCEAYILFVIQMKGIREFTPNQETHPQFAEALRLAANAGVHVLAYDCIVTEDSMEIDLPVRVKLPDSKS